MQKPVPLPDLSDQAHPAVRTALVFAQKHLSNTMRSDGLTYTEHGAEVARTLMEVTSDSSLLAVAVLHDIAVHPAGKKLLDQSPLSKEERALVLSMHGLRKLHIDVNVRELDRVIDAFAEDSRLLMLRMAHRLNDVRHLERFPASRQKEIARETLHMYTAISGHLGFHRWRWQMEDRCFLILQPQAAHHMQRKFEMMRETDMACLNHAHTFILEKLRDQGLQVDIEERIKGLYSTYRKMVLKNRRFEDLTDRLALRVLVPTIDDCYRTLGIIHQHMHPMRYKLKDYIGTPKENGYRSIHTVVYPLAGVTELPIEIQIRTPDMHRECEYGLASHGDYKNRRYSLSSPESRANLFRNFEHLTSALKSHKTFRQALHDAFREDRILLFDPQNRVYRIPKPATALDFACHVQPDSCTEITAVRINGRERPIDTILTDGDTVEVLVDGKRSSLEKKLEACKHRVTREILLFQYGRKKQKQSVT